MRGVLAAALLTMVSCSTIQSTVEEVLSKLENYKFEGTGRAEGLSEARVEQVTQMLRASQGGQIQPAVMTQIWNIIEGLFAGYMTERNDAQLLIDDYDNHWAQCHNSSSRQTYLDAYGVADGWRQSHEACRTTEKAYYQSEQNLCLTTFAALANHGQPGCDVLTGLPAGPLEGNQWLETIGHIVIWFTTSQTIVTNTFAPCQEAGENWVETRSWCNANQTNFESEMCAACALHSMSCLGEKDCYDRVNNEYAALESTVFDQARTRMNHVGVLKYLQCVVNVIKIASGDNETTVSEDSQSICGHLLDDFAQHTSYNNSVWPGGDRSACDLDQVICPYNSTFRSTEYAHIEEVPSPVVPVLALC